MGDKCSICKSDLFPAPGFRRAVIQFNQSANGAMRDKYVRLLCNDCYAALEHHIDGMERALRPRAAAPKEEV